MPLCYEIQSNTYPSSTPVVSSSMYWPTTIRAKALMKCYNNNCYNEREVGLYAQRLAKSMS